MKTRKTAARALIFVLVAVMLLSVCLTSCQNVEDPQNETTPGQTDPTTPEETTLPVIVTTTSQFEDHNIPEDAKFNGEKVRLLVWDSGDKEFYCETTSGDTISNSIYERNLDVEIMLEAELDFTEIDGGYNKDADFVNAVKTAASSNDDNYDLLAGYPMNISACILQGLLGDINELPYVELDRTWYNQSSRSAGTLAGKSFLITGDISYSRLARSSGIFFNDDLRKERGIEEDPYQLVIDDKWTIKKLTALIENAYHDVNGDGIRDNGDIYGFVVDHTQLSTVYYAAGYSFCELDPATGNQVISSDVTNEIVSNIIDDWNLATHGKGGILVDTDDETIFNAGNGVFYTYPLFHVSNELRDVTFKYGFVPMPKATDNQKEYYSSVTNTATLWGIPANLRNADISGAVLEAMSYGGYTTITPAVFEVAYKVKYSSDESGVQSAIFDILSKNIRFDFGKINSSSLLDQPNALFAGCIRDNINNYSIKANNSLKVVQNKLDALIKSVS